MKLASFSIGGDGVRLGAITPDLSHIVDLKAALAARGDEDSGEFDHLLALIEAGRNGLDKAEEIVAWAMAGGDGALVLSLSAVRLEPPMRRPPKLRCFSVYDQHLARAFRAGARLRLGPVGARIAEAMGLLKTPAGFYARPAYYKGNSCSISGPDEEIRFPAGSRLRDYEVELAVIIGKPGLNIGEDEAMDHVWGYCPFNDFSAREMVTRDLLSKSRMGMLKGKDFHTGNALGPWVTTRDEVLDPYALEMTVRVNGELWSETSTGGMSHSISAQIAEASRHEMIVAGEVFGTGCPAHGCGFEELRFLKPGDTVEIEVRGLGRLRNTISAEPC